MGTALASVGTTLGACSQASSRCRALSFGLKTRKIDQQLIAWSTYFVFFVLEFFYRILNGLLSYQPFEGAAMALFSLLVLLLAFYPILTLFKRLIDFLLQKVLRQLFQQRERDFNTKGSLNLWTLNLFVCFYLLVSTNFLLKIGVMHALAPYFGQAVPLEYLWKLLLGIYLRVCFAGFLLACLTLFEALYETFSSPKKVPLSVPIHILKLFLQIATLVSIASFTLNLSLDAFITKLLGATLGLIFIFKDTLIGLFASIQLTMQDLMRVGDWVTIPKYGADGTVESITISVLKIRNFDNTLVTVPTHAAVSGSFQNWRAMQLSGGRRIKRSVFFNIDSAVFCDDPILKRLKKHELTNSFMEEEGGAILKEGGAVSNLTLFRHYIAYYLRKSEKIHTTRYTFLVRQLQPTEHGVPLELYVFTKTTNWIAYEKIQTEIFEHIFSITPFFGLEIFQRSYTIRK